MLLHLYLMTIQNIMQQYLTLYSQNPAESLASSPGNQLIESGNHIGTFCNFFLILRITIKVKKNFLLFYR
jgi:hypothetical protein